MSSNFKSNKNNLWEINSNNLLFNRQKVIIKNKISPQTEEIFQEELSSSIASMWVDPSDDVDLPMISRSIYVGKKGYLSFLTEQNDVKTIHVTRDASFFDIKTSRILFTNTTASSIIVLF